MALRIISTIFKVIGEIDLFITLFIAIGICGTSATSGVFIDEIAKQLGLNITNTGVASGLMIGLIAGGIILYTGGLQALVLIAIGDLISVLISIEENTRKTSLEIGIRRINGSPSLSEEGGKFTVPGSV